MKDPVIKYPLFGGGAGGGKTWLGSEWETTNCYIYPETRWFIGREELSRLYQTTFITLMKVFKSHGIPRTDWKLNGKYNYIEFIDGQAKGSRIDFLDLKYLPSDPLFERFGSLEYTGGWIEEGGEIEFEAFDRLKASVGRHMNDIYKIPPKILTTCNPKKNWLYNTFYLPWKEGRLPAEYAFIQSLFGDNTFSSENYKQQLESISNPSTKERLMFGNWEYDDDPTVLIAYEVIMDLFTNSVELADDKYLSIDVARFGKDKTVFTIWKGLHAEKIIIKQKLSIPQTIEFAKQISEEEKIPRSHIVVDEDGVGGGVVDGLPGCRGFMANSQPTINPITKKPENYENLKTQCAYKLAELSNAHKIKVSIGDERIKKELIQEFEQLKSKDADKDSKLKIVPKDEIKKKIGRSPDLLDTFVMRMVFEIRKFKLPEFRVLG